MALYPTQAHQPDIPRVRVGYVWVPHLGISVALREHPELEGRPVILADDSHGGGGTVVDASDECLDVGVRVGRPLREAREYRPDAAILHTDPLEIPRAHEALLDAIAVVAPIVEDDCPGRGYFAPDPPADREDGRWILATLRALVRERLGFRVRLALAPNKFVARVACERDPDAGTGTPIVFPQESEEYLSPLPIDILPLEPRALERLRLLGIHTVGGFRGLPQNGVARRFGKEAAVAHALARGMDDRPIVARKLPEVRTERRALESPVETLEPVRAVAGALLERLCAGMRSEGQTFRTLGIALECENGQVMTRTASLRTPVAEPAPCLWVLRALVEAAAGNSPVIAVSVAISGLAPAKATQPALFEITTGREDRSRRLAEATREIGRRYPRRLRRVSPSEIPTLLDEHRFSLLPYERDTHAAPQEVPHSARRYVQVERRGERPYLVEGGRPDELLAICGCWRADEWWPEKVERIYWRMRTRSGRILTLSHDDTGYRLVEVFD